MEAPSLNHKHYSNYYSLSALLSLLAFFSTWLHDPSVLFGFSVKPRSRLQNINIVHVSDNLEAMLTQARNLPFRFTLRLSPMKSTRAGASIFRSDSDIHCSCSCKTHQVPE